MNGVAILPNVSFSLAAGRPHVGDHVGSERAIAAGADPEPVGAGAGPTAGGGLVPPRGARPGLQDQHPERYRIILGKWTMGLPRLPQPR